MKEVIRLEKISFSYNSIPVLRDINLTVNDGEFLGIVGPNAGGKSTLLKLILGLLRPDTGKIFLFGGPIDKQRTTIGYVPQYPTFLRDFPISVCDVVLMGRLGQTARHGSYTEEDKAIANDSLAAAGIVNLYSQTIDSLSGGQLQRVLIARALASRPTILILDEPTANIDTRAEGDIFDLLKQYNTHMTIITVSHDIAFISGYVDRVACLNQTILCHETADISGKTIEELYGMPIRSIQHDYRQA